MQIKQDVLYLQVQRSIAYSHLTWLSDLPNRQEFINLLNFINLSYNRGLFQVCVINTIS